MIIRKLAKVYLLTIISTCLVASPAHKVKQWRDLVARQLTEQAGINMSIEQAREQYGLLINNIIAKGEGACIASSEHSLNECEIAAIVRAVQEDRASILLSQNHMRATGRIHTNDVNSFVRKAIEDKLNATPTRNKQSTTCTELSKRVMDAINSNEISKYITGGETLYAVADVLQLTEQEMLYEEIFQRQRAKGYNVRKISFDEVTERSLGAFIENKVHAINQSNRNQYSAAYVKAQIDAHRNVYKQKDRVIDPKTGEITVTYSKSLIFNTICDLCGGVQLR